MSHLSRLESLRLLSQRTRVVVPPVAVQPCKAAPDAVPAEDEAPVAVASAPAAPRKPAKRAPK